MSAALVIEGVSVRLGASDIVGDVDLRIRPGEIVAVIGPSGAGKTTLFRALVGEIPCRKGRILLGDGDVTWLPLWQRARRGLGYVPQTPSVLLDLSVEDNLRTFEALVAPPEPRGPEAWAERIGLAHRLALRARDLSGGERRRLEVGRALIARPRVLVCDEPFAGIDPAGVRGIAELLRAEADRGVAVLLADHHLAEALQISDRAALLFDGRIVALASPDEVRGHPSLRQRYLGLV